MKTPRKTKGSVKDLVLSWNQRRPLDRWWRERYKIPFNSPTHREVSYIDIVFEYQEHVWVEDYKESYLQKREDKEGFTTSGLLFKDVNTVSNKEEVELFENIKF